MEKFQYKFIIVEPNNIRWESGNENRTFDFNQVKDSKRLKYPDYEIIYDMEKKPDILKLKCDWRR